MRYVLAPALLASTALTVCGVLSFPAMASDAAPAAPVRLAQNDSNSGNVLSLYQTIQQLQQQVRNLQGQVDTLKYQIKQNDQSQRDLYQNLDNRLSALENNGGSAGARAGNRASNGGGAPSGNAGNSGSSGSGAVGGGSDYGSGDYGGSSGGSGNSSGSSVANVNSTRVSPDVQSAYMDGFNQLKGGEYSAAIKSFKQFVSQYPSTSLTDNAWYWLGEAYYVQQQYSDAGQAFETVVNQFSGSQKVPSSLYKIGLIQLAQNKNDNATATFNRIRDQYPNSDAAGMAEQKLQSSGG